MANISFGTDGFRGILGQDFNIENVKIIVKACAKYIAENYGTHKQIIIGYDPRNQAYEYAMNTANLLIAYGFDVAISEDVIPTPIIAFCAKHYNATSTPTDIIGDFYNDTYTGFS